MHQIYEFAFKLQMRATMQQYNAATAGVQPGKRVFQTVSTNCCNLLDTQGSAGTSESLHPAESGPHVCFLL